MVVLMSFPPFKPQEREETRRKQEEEDKAEAARRKEEEINAAALKVREMIGEILWCIYYSYL